MSHNYVYYVAIGAIVAALFCIIGTVVLMTYMFKEIDYYRDLKKKHGQNIKRLASKLPMWRSDAINKEREREALRKLSIAVIGYCSRLEKHLRALDAREYVNDVIGSGPPIFAAIEAIRANDWQKYDEIMNGYASERARKS